MRAKTAEDAIPKRLWMVVWDYGGKWKLWGCNGCWTTFSSAKKARESASNRNYLFEENRAYKIIRVR